MAGASNSVYANTTGIVGFTGTGFAGSTMTQYTVVCGGSTSSTQQQVSGTGTTGQLLTSNGAGALPTWQTISSAFASINVQVFTGNGTYTYTPTAGMLYCIIEVVGAGGGGGGCAASGASTSSAGGGGGGGGYSLGVFSASSIGASKTVTVGKGGAGGSAGNNAGSTGGTSSVGVLLSATGGGGGSGNSASATNFVAGAAGGSGSSGSVNLNGQAGGIGWNSVSASVSIAGFGGGTQKGNSTQSATTVVAGVQAGPGGQIYGGGGGGGCNGISAAAQAGGSGADGIVIITEYV
jgi:hypothetical protein